MKYFDLSYNIENGMSVYPGDPDVEIQQDKFFHVDGYNNFRLHIGTHVGTHIDAPMHMTKDKKFISEFSVDRFCGRAVVFDVRGRNVISMSDLNIETVTTDDIVLFYTGYDEKYGTESYYLDHPTIDIKVAEVFVRKNVKLIGVDMPSPDKYPYGIHKLLLSNGIFIVENLNNLKSLLEYKAIEVYMIPLKVKSDASLVRAVAKVDL